MKPNDSQKLIEAYKKIEEMKQLATQDGFIATYYRELKNYRTFADCFNAVNEKYYEYFGKYRYTDYHSFRQILKRKLKKV